MFVILSILLTLLILSILVLVHEIGHFTAARSIGLPVESFSIGMGPVIKRWKWARFGDTEFRLSLVPFGGYVMVPGESEDSDNPNSFYSKTPWQRIWYAAAGVLMNIIFAVVIFVVSSLAFGDFGIAYNRVGMLQPGAARNAGIQQGEWLLYVNQTPTPEWINVPTEIRKLPNKEITLLVGTDADPKTVSVSGDMQASIFGKEPSAFSNTNWPESKEVLENTFLVIDGKYYHLDSVSKVGDKEVSNWNQAVEAFKEISAPTDVTFDKSVETREVKLTTGIGHDEEGKEVGVIGIAPSASIVRLPFFEALWFGLQKFWFYILAILGAIGGLFRGNFENVGGVVAIGDMLGQSANLGISYVFNIAGQLSVALAIFNLIPFPGLDGSRIFFSLIEGITKKKLPRTVENIIHGVGFIILMILLVALVGRDIIQRLFK
jgi:regulator of sigma E protease